HSCNDYASKNDSKAICSHVPNTKVRSRARALSGSGHMAAARATLALPSLSLTGKTKRDWRAGRGSTTRHMVVGETSQRLGRCTCKNMWSAATKKCEPTIEKFKQNLVPGSFVEDELKRKRLWLRVRYRIGKTSTAKTDREFRSSPKTRGRNRKTLGKVLQFVADIFLPRMAVQLPTRLERSFTANEVPEAGQNYNQEMVMHEIGGHSPTSSETSNSGSRRVDTTCGSDLTTPGPGSSEGGTGVPGGWGASRACMTPRSAGLEREEEKGLHAGTSPLKADKGLRWRNLLFFTWGPIEGIPALGKVLRKVWKRASLGSKKDAAVRLLFCIQRVYTSCKVDACTCTPYRFSTAIR
ncbi:hypothetical protein BaRGS_00008094, partial [Batillaria attramentaria]